MKPEIKALIVIGISAVISLYTAVWAYKDARKRNTSGVLVCLLVLFCCWPFGLLAWLIFRPKVKSNGDIPLVDPDIDLKQRANDGTL
jgi:hypothetical protein